MIAKVPDFDLHSLGVDLSDPGTAKQATDLAGMAANILPGGAIVQNAGMFAAGVLGDSFEGAISWKLMKNRYGDLLLTYLGEAVPADHKAMMKRLEQIGDDRLRALVETNEDLSGLLSELRLVDETVASSPTKHLAGLAGAAIGAAAMPIGGMVGTLVGGAAGGFGGSALADSLSEKKAGISTVRMYETMIPFMQMSLEEGGGVDEGQVYAMLVARSHDPKFIKTVEEQLGMTLEEALQAHHEARQKGKAQESALTRLAESCFDNADFAASCKCSCDDYDITLSIPQQMAERINRGMLDPRALVLGDLPMLKRQPQPLETAAHLGGAPDHGLPPVRHGKRDTSLTI